MKCHHSYVTSKPGLVAFLITGMSISSVNHTLNFGQMPHFTYGYGWLDALTRHI